MVFIPSALMGAAVVAVPAVFVLGKDVGFFRRYVGAALSIAAGLIVWFVLGKATEQSPDAEMVETYGLQAVILTVLPMIGLWGVSAAGFAMTIRGDWKRSSRAATGLVAALMLLMILFVLGLVLVESFKL